LTKTWNGMLNLASLFNDESMIQYEDSCSTSIFTDKET
jgi:hypothetical protein